MTAWLALTSLSQLNSFGLLQALVAATTVGAVLFAALRLGHAQEMGEQRGLEFRITPGLGHHMGAVFRPDAVFISVDDRVYRGRIHQPFCGQHAFQRLDPQGRFRRQQRVRMIGIRVVMWHGVILPASRGYVQSTDALAPLARVAYIAHQPGATALGMFRI